MANKKYKTEEERLEATKRIKKEYYEKNKIKLLEENKEWKNKNKDKVLISNKKYNKKYYQENKEKINEVCKNYYKENKEIINTRNNNYIKKLRKENDLFKFKVNVRTRISKALKNIKTQKTDKTEKLLGCSYDDFKIYIESKFEPWMSWENRGLYNGEKNFGWDIDHIIPLSNAKTLLDLIPLIHHSNCQPLCSYINRDVKKNKVE